MERRALGGSGLSVPPLVFGGNVLGWTADEATSHRLLDALVEAGLGCVDTADIYSAWAPGHSGGESEEVVGRWLRARGRSHDVTILTKVGGEMPGRGKGLGAAWIARACDDSLRRLGVERIDLYQAHFDDASVPVEETLGAFARLVEAGKVRAIGASNFTAARLAEALDASARLGLPRYESLQPHHNLVEREAERDLLPLCRARGLGWIPYFSLAAGFLTGKYRTEADLSKSPRGGRNVAKYLASERGPRALAALDAVAGRLGATPARVALAWLMATPGVTAPIASATTLDQLADLVAATRLRLDAEAMAALDAAGAPEGQTQG